MYDLIKDEFYKLKKANVIDDEVYQRILDYYEEKEVFELGTIKNTAKESEIQEKISKTEKTVPVNSVPVLKSTPVIPKKSEVQAKKINVTILLSIISAALIGGGIISLIAYNWNEIPRFVKSVFAFLVCVLPPALYSVLTYIRKKPFERKSKEFFSCIWDLLFGGSIAFVSQIYRMASNPVGFFIVWIIVSIGITYSLKSYFAYYFSLLLIIIYSVYAQEFAYSTAVAYYPAMFLLYFFAKNNKKAFYIWIVELIGLLGIVFEKNLPGLWILSYVSADILLLHYAEKKNEKTLKIMGYMLGAGLSIILSFPYFWKNIGFTYFRNNANYHLWGSLFDYVTTVVLYISSFAVVIPKIIKKIKTVPISECLIEIFQGAFLTLLGISYICCSVNSVFSIYVNRLFILVYIGLLIMTYSSSKWKYTPLFFVPLFYVSIIGEINYPLIFIPGLFIAFDIYLRRINFGKYENKISVYAAYLFIIILRFYKYMAEEPFLFMKASEETAIFDFIFGLVIITFFMIGNILIWLRTKKYDRKELLTGINGYLVFGVFAFLSILIETDASWFDLGFNISLILINVSGILLFFINKSEESFISFGILLISYFIGSKALTNEVFVLSFILLVISSIYYLKPNKYFYSLFVSAALFIGFIINNTTTFFTSEFKPFSSSVESILFILLLSWIFVVPIAGTLLQKKKIDWLSLNISIFSCLFITLEGTADFINFNNLIFVLIVISIVTGTLEFFISGHKEKIFPVCTSLVCYIVSVANSCSVFNQILFASVVLYASYSYIKRFTSDKIVKEVVYPVLYSVLVLILFIINVDGVCDNEFEYTNLPAVKDIVLALAVSVPVVLAPIWSVIRKKDFVSISSAYIVLVSIVFSVFNRFCTFFDFDCYYRFVYAGAIFTGLIDCFILKNKTSLSITGAALVECVYVLECGIYEVDYGIFMIVGLLAFSLLIYSKVLYKESSSINSLFTVLFSLFLVLGLIHEVSYSADLVINMAEFCFCLIVIIGTLFILPCYFIFKNKYKINYAVFGYLILSIVSFMLYRFNENIDLDLLQNIYQILIMIIVFGFAILGIISGFEKKSIKNVNIYLFFMCICFVIRFFNISGGLVERGVVCIGCGIGILITNLLLSKKLKVSSDDKEGNKE